MSTRGLGTMRERSADGESGARLTPECTHRLRAGKPDEKRCLGKVARVHATTLTPIPGNSGDRVHSRKLVHRSILRIPMTDPRSHLSTALANRYRIERELGA